MSRLSVWGWSAVCGHQNLPVGEFLLPSVFLRPVSSEDDINLPINARESPASTSSLLLRLTWFGGLSSWRGRRQWLKRSVIPDRVLEISTVPQGVPHILVVWPLRFKDLIQCLYPTTGCHGLEWPVAQWCALPPRASCPSACLTAGSCPSEVLGVQASYL